MTYKQNYVIYYWFTLRDGSSKKGEIPLQAENRLSPEFRFEHINLLIEKIEPNFSDRKNGDYFIRQAPLLLVDH